MILFCDEELLLQNLASSRLQEHISPIVSMLDGLGRPPNFSLSLPACAKVHKGERLRINCSVQGVPIPVGQFKIMIFCMLKIMYNVLGNHLVNGSCSRQY